MCYSALVTRSLKKIEREYAAQLSWPSFVDLYRLRDRDPSLKIPDGMAEQLVELGGTGAAEVKRLDNKFRVEERQRRDLELQAVQADLAGLEAQQAKKATATRQKSIDAKRRKVAKLQAGIAAPSVASAGGYRIYPYQFAPIILADGAQRLIVPARYRILLRTGVEVPHQYNVFNARRDSLQGARNWKPLFGQKHAIFPFERFFEWVSRDGKPTEISFSPDGHESMHAASLYEECERCDVGLVRSFAMVTDDPPPEVAAAGHDRCPVFLQGDLIEQWLHPQGQQLDELDALLAHKEPTYYSHAVAA